MSAANPSELHRGWLKTARQVCSPNFNARPVDCAVSLLVIHNISLPPGEFGGDAIEHFFCNELDCSTHPYYHQLAQLKVSSHLLITRLGEMVQFVSLDSRAWHAGESIFEGRRDCNDFSIGIEMEGTDDTAYAQCQYQQLARVTRLLLETFPAMSWERITGHADIAPGRKTDPGAAFDWDYYRELTLLRGDRE